MSEGVVNCTVTHARGDRQTPCDRACRRKNAVYAWPSVEVNIASRSNWKAMIFRPQFYVPVTGDLEVA